MKNLCVCLYDFGDKGDIFSAGGFLTRNNQEAIESLANFADEMRGTEVEILEVQIVNRKVIPVEQLKGAS